MDRVHVTGNLDRMMAQNVEGCPCLRITVLLHQPSRTFRAEEDEKKQRNSGDEGSTQHQTPVVGTNVVDGKVDSRAEEDTEGSPHLPGHD
ncbi:hypothetical protein RRF57_008558 [Xylaria bambusicola]|uniref:Uncharacterized protein n=1 Tax=Xylaria bambusicola TaxID=326684 RepID=A0AAN7USB6_9PEZI